MKNLIFFLFGVSILFACGNGDKTEKNSEDDSAKVEVAEDTDATPEIKEPYVFSYKFSNPDTTLFFATKNGIFYLNEVQGRVDTILKDSNIVDFAMKDDYIVYATKNEDKIYDFYYGNIKSKSMTEILEISETDLIDSLRMELQQDDIEYANISLEYVFDDDTGFFADIYYQDENAYNETTGWNFSVGSDYLGLGADWCYNKISLEEYNDFYADFNERFFYSPDSGLVFDEKLIFPDSPVNMYCPCYQDSYYLLVSPDSTKVLWVAEIGEVDQGAVYIYFVINLDGSGYVEISPNDEFYWTSDNILIYIDGDSYLKMITPDNKIMKITDEETVRFATSAENQIIASYQTYAD